MQPGVLQNCTMSLHINRVEYLQYKVSQSGLQLIGNEVYKKIYVFSTLWCETLTGHCVFYCKSVKLFDELFVVLYRVCCSALSMC